jgi:hypothetical protein
LRGALQRTAPRSVRPCPKSGTDAARDEQAKKEGSSAESVGDY